MRSYAILFSWYLLFLMSATFSEAQLASKPIGDVEQLGRDRSPRSSGPHGPRGPIGPKGKAPLPFCPLGKQTSRYKEEISYLIKGRSSGPSKKFTVKSGAQSGAKGRNSCLLPCDCKMAALLWDESGGGHGLQLHGPLIECCAECDHPNFTVCNSDDSKDCGTCILEGLQCMSSCISKHRCPTLERLGTPGLSRRPGPVGAKGDRCSKSPTKQPNVCPTRKIKIGKSYCIQRTCIPVA